MTANNFPEKPESTASSAAGGVIYPDASKLLRPQRIKGPALIAAGVLVAAAAFVGVNFVSNAADALYFSEVRKASQIEQNMAREVSYDFPQLVNYATSSDAQEIYDVLSGDRTLVMLSAEGLSADGFDAFRLPEDISAEEGASALKNGIGSMDVVEASKLLNGGWRFTLDLSNYHDVKMRYTDFKSTTVEEAILSAIRAQGFDGDNSQMTKEGVDESGNTYKSGSIDIDDETYYWRVSAVKFNDAYSIKGMPDTALYVGVRITD